MATQQELHERLTEIEGRLDLALGTGLNPPDPADFWKKPDDEEVNELLAEYTRLLRRWKHPWLE